MLQTQLPLPYPPLLLIFSVGWEKSDDDNQRLVKAGEPSVLQLL